MSELSGYAISEWHNADYAAKRLAEIRQRHYPNGNTIQMIDDFEWLIDEAGYLRELLEADRQAWRKALS